jgi:hypothetical protein
MAAVAARESNAHFVAVDMPTVSEQGSPAYNPGDVRIA